MKRLEDRSTLSKLASQTVAAVQHAGDADAAAREGDAAIAAFTLLADTIERFDTLLMEIRHLQTNLIYFMRAPELHAALRYEESYIFGSCTVREGDRQKHAQKDWSRLFGDSPDTVSLAELPRLAEAFVPFLPLASDEYGFDMLNGDLMERPADRAFPDLYSLIDLRDQWRNVLAPIVRTLRRRRATGQEDDSYGTSYHVFVALQGIKRNIVHDKLHLAWYGVRAFIDPKLEPAVLLTGNRARRQSAGAERRADFMIARSLAAYNIREHIRALSDFHTYFEKTIDVGLQENHRPITGRRREQGMYHFMLGERSKDMFIAASRVVHRLAGERQNGNIYRGMPVFIHRWSHDYTTRNRAIPSFTRSRRVASYQTRKNEVEDTSYTRESESYTAFTVNTSFFMPDRPDLQPIIAHEAVHCVVLELFDQMAVPSKRLGQADTFARFWSALVDAARQADGLRADPKARPNSEAMSLVREMMVDTIAASVTGKGYLFALFQELCGEGLQEFGRTPSEREWADITGLREKLEARYIHTAVSSASYLRLCLACETAKKLETSLENTTFSQGMIEGVKQTLDDLLVRVSIIRSDDATYDGKGDANEGFTKKLRNSAKLYIQAAENSGIWAELAEIRDMNFHIGEGLADARPEQPQRYPVFAEEMRARLIEYYIERKLANYQRPLHKVIQHRARHPDRDIGAKWFKLSPLTSIDIAPRQLSEARTSRIAAANAIVAFAEFYLHGENAVNQRRDLRRQFRILVRHEKAGSKDAAKAVMDEMLLELPCFFRLGDMAWQTSYFRTMEMVAQLGSDNDDPMTTLSKDYAPGRESLQLAIEFWGFERRVSIHALAEATRLQMNILKLPVSEITNWRPKLEDPSKQGPRLDPSIERVLPGDAVALRGTLERMTRLLKKNADKSKLATEAARVLDNANGMDADTLRAEMATLAAQGVRTWLGSDLDADFFEVQALGMLQDAATNYGGDARIDAQVRKMLWRQFADGKDWESHRQQATENAVLNYDKLVTALDEQRAHDREPTDKDDAWELSKLLKTYRSGMPPRDDFEVRTVFVRAMLNIAIDAIIARPSVAIFPDFRITVASLNGADPSQSNVRRLSQSESARRLIDDCTQALRVFELSHILKQGMDAVEGTNGKKPEEIAARLGALQILKLDPGYPHIVFPLQAREKIPWSLKRLKTMSDPERKLGLMPLDDCHPVIAFLGRKDTQAMPVHTQALVAISAADLLWERLCGIREDFPDAFKAGVDYFCENGDDTLAQIDTRPITTRLIGDIAFAKRVNVLAHHKMRAMHRALSFPEFEVQELAPLRTLLARMQADATGADNSDHAQDVIRETIKALSRGGDGLRAFKTLYVSRQSLVDTHWWREIDTPEAVPQDGDDPLQRSWAVERSYASFYHETPHKKVKLPEGDCDLPAVPAVRRVATLGRYDFFSFSSNVIFGQQRLPLMDRSTGHDASTVFGCPDKAYSKLEAERVYRAFFMRGEFALSLSLNGEPVNMTAPRMTYQPVGATAKDKDILAILSLRLDRRSSRLEFVQRLRHAVSDWRDYRAAAKGLVEVDVGPNNLALDDIHDPQHALKTALKRHDGRENRFVSPVFRKSLFDALGRAVGHREYDLKHAARGFDPKDLELDDPRVLPDDLAMNLAQASSDYFELQAKRRTLPTRLAMGYEAARYFGELPAVCVEGAGPFVQPGDAALLGEGWGDLYIVLFCDRAPVRQPGIDFDAAHADWLLRGVRRLYDVFALQHALFQDYSVYRTETFLRPVAIPFAATDKDRMQVSLSVRSREDRELDGVVQRVLRAVRQKAQDHLPRNEDSDGNYTETPEDWRKRLHDTFTIAHVPGRNDFEVSIRDVDAVRSRPKSTKRLRERSPSNALELMHEIAGTGEADGGSGTEEILTRISFRHSIVPQEKELGDGSERE